MRQTKPNPSNMRKAAKIVKTKAKKMLKGSRSRGATPPGSRSSTPAPEPGNPQLQVPSTDQALTTTLKTVVDTLETTLSVLKEVSAVFPPLQAAVGGNVSGNTEALQVLAEDLITRTKFLQMQLERGNMDPSGMQSIKDLAGWVLIVL
ncbi:hypothetical protein D9757_011531 [Collybiopsis confluens]|uniref:Uncharacterized protein n=1 Tax=Collybiopsis confluens TaxID=2823264 RepID=A0A8H5H7A8_9AGAR|nr:hypothetical protein D9757_011531 [Collybiopsis confluens]